MSDTKNEEASTLKRVRLSRGDKSVWVFHRDDIRGKPVIGFKAKTTHKAQMSIYADRANNLFVAPSAIVQNFGYKNWATGAFIQAINSAGITVYRKVYTDKQYTYLIRLEDVTTFIEEFATMSSDNTMSDNKRSSRIQFVTETYNWWQAEYERIRTKALAKALAGVSENTTSNNPKLEPKEPPKTEENTSENTSEISAFVNGLKSMTGDGARTIVIALNLIAYRIIQMCNAGIPHGEAVKAAFNMVANEHKGENVREFLGKLAALVSVFNPALKGMFDHE